MDELLTGLLDVTEGYVLNGASSNSKNYLNKEFTKEIHKKEA